MKMYEKTSKCHKKSDLKTAGMRWKLIHWHCVSRSIIESKSYTCASHLQKFYKIYREILLYYKTKRNDQQWKQQQQNTEHTERIYSNSK